MLISYGFKKTSKISPMHWLLCQFNSFIDSTLQWQNNRDLHSLTLKARSPFYIFVQYYTSQRNMNLTLIIIEKLIPKFQQHDFLLLSFICVLKILRVLNSSAVNTFEPILCSSWRINHPLLNIGLVFYVLLTKENVVVYVMLLKIFLGVLNLLMSLLSTTD